MVLGKICAVSALEVTSRSTELELSALLWVILRAILRACEVDSRTEWVWLHSLCFDHPYYTSLHCNFTKPLELILFVGHSLR